MFAFLDKKTITKKRKLIHHKNNKAELKCSLKKPRKKLSQASQNTYKGHLEWRWRMVVIVRDHQGKRFFSFNPTLCTLSRSWRAEGLWKEKKVSTDVHWKNTLRCHINRCNRPSGGDCVFSEGFLGSNIWFWLFRFFPNRSDQAEDHCAVGAQWFCSRCTSFEMENKFNMPTVNKLLLALEAGSFFNYQKKGQFAPAVDKRFPQTPPKLGAFKYLSTF